MSTAIQATTIATAPISNTDATQARQKLAQLQRSYQTALNQGEAADSLKSLANQIATFATNAGVSVRLPSAATISANTAANASTTTGRFSITA